jgi:hypothetical protein
LPADKTDGKIVSSSEICSRISFVLLTMLKVGVKFAFQSSLVSQ